MDAKTQKDARALVGAAAKLLEEIGGPYGGKVSAEDLMPAVALLDLATGLVDGRADALEAKRARDRDRRAKAKPKPRPRPKKTTSPASKARGGIIDAL